MLSTILIFLAVLSILVLAHELGHFIMAKIFGMYVEEFGFGFPPRLFKIKIGETLYSLNLFPIGGFVKIYGEEHTECNERKKKDSDATCTILQREKKKKFYEFPGWKRLITLSAGVGMNFVLAWLFFTIVLGIGFPQEITPLEENKAQDKKILILEVMQDSPAQKAGLEIGDQILKFNNIIIDNVQQFQELAQAEQGREAPLIIKRGEEILGFSLTPRLQPPSGEGPLGIALGYVGIIKYPWYEIIFKGAEATLNTTKLILYALGDLIYGLIFQGKVAPGLAGPLGVAVFTQKVAKMGILALMQFTALISINLAIVNLLPIPALDGGRLLFLGIEKILGKKHNPQTEALIHKIGFALLISLMILVTFRDLLRFEVIKKLTSWF